MKRILFLTTILIIGVAIGANAQTGYTILHSFTGVDGTTPLGTLTSDGTRLYGTCMVGGSSGAGVVFSLLPDGSGYTVLHSFTGVPPDGASPWAGPVTDGDMLYGTCTAGGSGGVGVVYSVATDGSGYTILHSFTGVPPDGATPYAGVILSGGSLYGATSGGGAGTVYTLKTDGSGFSTLHSFGAPPDGQTPWGDLALSGDRLYGMTLGGGPAGLGTVFSLKTDGSGYTVLHDFGAPPDGSVPFGALLADGSTLYGMTNSGGSGWSVVPGGAYYGTIFSIGADGSGYTTLHSFAGGPNDGDSPFGSLVSDGSTLYGMTSYGGDSTGAYGQGTIFSIAKDGSGFMIEHDFQGAPSDGAGPWGSLISDGDTLYGLTPYGGSAGTGTVFGIALPPNYINLTVSPWFTSPGGTVTLSYSCDFGTYGYQGAAVDVYLALIRDPVAVNAPSSVADVLAGGAVYFFDDRARELYTGALRGPTWSGVAFPPVAASGTLTVTLPAVPGDYVLATAFRYAGTTIYVRSDGLPVENSPVFSVR